jgi:hypothetical protein
MDTKTILSQAKARFSHNQNKEYLKNKYESKLLVAEQGGLWKCTPELITFLDSANSQGIILQDSYGNPIGVKDREKLFYKVRDTYNTVMADWLNELTELEKNR